MGKPLYPPVDTNMHDLEFELLRSLKIKVIGDIRKLTYDFILVNNSKYMPICSILCDIAIDNMQDNGFLTFQRSRLMVPLVRGPISE